VRPGETVTAGDGRRLLVLDVMPFVEERARVRALLEVEELPAAPCPHSGTTARLTQR
jgi:hypothetical protein